MNNLGSNLYDFSSKDILINNSSLYQNNYYKEDKNISNNTNTRSDSTNTKNKYNTNSKNKYKVTYSNSILDNNFNSNIYQNLENKNVLIINNKINNSIGNIKEINFYSNKKIFSNNNNIKSHNFYNKKINEILNTENNIKNQINENNKSDNNISSENNNKYLINKTHSIIHNISNNRKTQNKNQSKTKNNKKNISPKKNGPKNIYAKYADKKRPSLPIGNKTKNKNNISIKKNKSKKKEEKAKNSKNKISFIQNAKSNKNKYNILSSNYYTNTFSNENNIDCHKNNLMPVSLKYNKKSQNKYKGKEIKKSQSQSFFKYKPNHDLNSSNNKYNNKSKSKNKNQNDMSYKGIIINKKNMIKNHLIKSSSHNNSTNKKSPVVCINNKSKYLINSNSKKRDNKIINKNYNHFMNNLPDEYNKDQLFIKIRNLWNKLKVTHSYQEMFITLSKQVQNDQLKKAIFKNEINNLTQILNNLNKLNGDIQKRNEIINKIKNYNNYNNISEIRELLNSLRMISIDIVFDYISFLKEISYDVLRNKFNLDSIKNFNKNYLTNMKTDTNFLHSHNYFNKLFNFSKKSDPFLLYPASKQKNSQCAILPINEETLEKIYKCEYFLLTEKIYPYSINKNKNNVNYLLFNDPDNIINNLIGTETIDKSINNTENNNCFSTIKNKESNSPFSTPINKVDNNNNEKTNITHKYEKYCYINNINNKSNENNEIQENLSSNNLINNITSKENNSNFNDNAESDKNNSIINNSNDITSSPIPNKIKINDLIINENSKNEINNNIIITPYIPMNDISLSSMYSTYLTSVSENVKQSFNINEDIFYYGNIGIYPKIIIFRDNKNIKIKGICTLSFNQTINTALNFNKKILTVTSISCSNGEKISEILLNLIEFCKNEEIFYESLEVNLYYIKKEDGNFVLDEKLEKEIKSEAKFKWVRLENDGEKRKIKYHYVPNNIITNKENSIFNNININNLDMNCNKCAVYLNNYVLMRYYEEQGINDISMEENSKLFFIIKLLNKYFLINENNNDIEKDVQNILTNLRGLKLKKIVRNISEYNHTLLTNISDFKNDYLCNENYNLDLLNIFLEIIEKIKNEKNNEENNIDNDICLDFNIICTNFSNIIKIDLNGYEYNIISMNDFIIEVFKISNDDNNKEVIYFTKSEIDNISFIFYEESDENQNNNDENYIKLLFNKVLKKILVKDTEEPFKSYKKLGIPSFTYQKKINNGNNENDKLNIIQYDILDCNESFDFCLENIPNYNTKFSFPLKNNVLEDNEIKIIKNNFVVAVLNSDLILDYHLPSMNIYYIKRECWIKTNKN